MNHELYHGDCMYVLGGVVVSCWFRQCEEKCKQKIKVINTSSSEL